MIDNGGHTWHKILRVRWRAFYGVATNLKMPYKLGLFGPNIVESFNKSSNSYIYNQ